MLLTLSFFIYLVSSPIFITGGPNTSSMIYIQTNKQREGIGIIILYIQMITQLTSNFPDISKHFLINKAISPYDVSDPYTFLNTESI